MISHNQNAFVPQRHIQDNLILVPEVMQIFKRKTGRGGLLAVKVDIEKVYDKIDWGFLMEIIRLDLAKRGVIGFSSVFPSSLMAPRMVFLGHDVGFAKVTPYRSFSLFWLWRSIRDLLTARRVVRFMALRQLFIPLQLLTFSLQMAMLFYCTNQGEVRQLQKSIKTFARWLGQVINSHESFIRFRNNLSLER